MERARGRGPLLAWVVCFILAAALAAIVTSGSVRQPDGTGYCGTYRGVVISNEDPEGLGRIEVQVPSLLGDESVGWAVPSLPCPWFDGGEFEVPPVGSSVWVQLEEGSLHSPIWTGWLWETLESLGGKWHPGDPDASDAGTQVRDFGVRIPVQLGGDLKGWLEDLETSTKVSFLPLSDLEAAISGFLHP